MIRKILCALGFHIPAAAISPLLDGRILYEVYCQECTKSLTKNDWEKYHHKKLESIM